MRVFLGLGSNIGNREANLRLALLWLAPECRIVAVSSLYASAAVVLEGQAPGPDFLNAACEVETGLSPAGLLAHVKRVEHDIGRRPAGRWTPRPIDIDILLYGDRAIDEAVLAEDSPWRGGHLTVPHPLLAERNFVVLPLAEIAPEVTHPTLGRAIGEIAGDADFEGLTWIAGPDWAAGEASSQEDAEDGE